MKKFLQVVTAIKETVAMSYTAAMCIYIFFLFVFRHEAVSPSMLLSMLLACVVAGVMQVAAFTTLLIKRLSYLWRTMLFVVVYGGILAALAVGFGWFPTDNVLAWVEFAVIFAVIFLFIFAGIEVYYRLSGKKYDSLLGLYRQKQQEEQK